VGHLAEYVYRLPGPLPSGAYSAFINLGTMDPSTSMQFETALVLRTDGGADRVLFSTTVDLALLDGGPGIYSQPYVGFDAGLGAIPAHCGDLLVLQVTQLSDAGMVFEAFPDLTVP
jgi:hypothetical protein